MLEVMIAVSIISISLIAILKLQSQGLSLANEAQFNTTAPLLAQNKMAEIETCRPNQLYSQDGDFGDKFPDYTWKLNINDFIPDMQSSLFEIKQIDLEIEWGTDDLYHYSIRFFKLLPKS